MVAILERLVVSHIQDRSISDKSITNNIFGDEGITEGEIMDYGYEIFFEGNKNLKKDRVDIVCTQL